MSLGLAYVWLVLQLALQHKHKTGNSKFFFYKVHLKQIFFFFSRSGKSIDSMPRRAFCFASFATFLSLEHWRMTAQNTNELFRAQLFWNLSTWRFYVVFYCSPFLFHVWHIHIMKYFWNPMWWTFSPWLPLHIRFITFF